MAKLVPGGLGLSWPGDENLEARRDERAFRVAPWSNARVQLQAGKFAPVVENWGSRHGSWDNPFVTAPLPCENPTPASTSFVPPLG